MLQTASRKRDNSERHAQDAPHKTQIPQKHDIMVYKPPQQLQSRGTKFAAIFHPHLQTLFLRQMLLLAFVCPA